MICTKCSARYPTSASEHVCMTCFSQLQTLSRVVRSKWIRIYSHIDEYDPMYHLLRYKLDLAYKTSDYRTNSGYLYGLRSKYLEAIKPVCVVVDDTVRASQQFKGAVVDPAGELGSLALEAQNSILVANEQPPRSALRGRQLFGVANATLWMPEVVGSQSVIGHEEWAKEYNNGNYWADPAATPDDTSPTPCLYTQSELIGPPHIVLIDQTGSAAGTRISPRVVFHKPFAEYREKVMEFARSLGNVLTY